MSLEGGREASKRLWRKRDFAMKLGADLVSRGHRHRPRAPLVRETMRTQAAVLCCRLKNVKCRVFREPVTPRERGAVRSEGMGRFAASQTPPRIEWSGPQLSCNIVLLLDLTRFCLVGCWSVEAQAGSLPARGRRLWPAAERTTLAASPLRSLRRHRPRWPTTLPCGRSRARWRSPPELAFDDTEDAALRRACGRHRGCPAAPWRATRTGRPGHGRWWSRSRP